MLITLTYITYKVNVVSQYTFNYQLYVEMNLSCTVVKGNLYFVPIYTHIK